MSVRTRIVDLKQFYTRGSTWFSYIFQVGIITANAKLFEDFFRIWFGINVVQTVVLGVVGYIIVATFIGFIDRTERGIWQDENDWVWNSTPSARKMGEDVREIKRMMEER